MTLRALGASIFILIFRISSLETIRDISGDPFILPPQLPFSREDFSEARELARRTLPGRETQEAARAEKAARNRARARARARALAAAHARAFARSGR